MATVLVTRARKQAAPFADALRRAGFTPIFFPVIHIRPLDDLTRLHRAAARLETYDWVIFSSVNAVEIFCDAVPPSRRGSLGTRPRVAAVGPKTRASLEERGIPVAFVPAKYSGEHILPGLGALDGVRVLLPRARVARPLLPREIATAGGICDDIPIYDTVPASPDPEGLAALRDGVDAVTFTSPSTVRNFITLTEQAGLNPRSLPGAPVFACIGPVTAAAARETALSPCIIAADYTTDGLIAALSTRNVFGRGLHG
jgi:uroporphyrinogen-III synthase